MIETTAWGEDDSDRDAIRVCWDTGVINSYRVGFNGKVDLKCIETAAGFEFYPDHLPFLGMFNHSYTYYVIKFQFISYTCLCSFIYILMLEMCIYESLIITINQMRFDAFVSIV